MVNVGLSDTPDFDPARAEEAKDNFPSKMMSYLGIGLPPFFHGPADSGPARFVRRHNADHVCSQQVPQLILDEMASALGNPRRSEAWRQRCLSLAATEFSTQVPTGRLNALLGISDT